MREIAEETISKEDLKNDLISEYQTTTFSEDEDLNEIEDNSDQNQLEESEIAASEEKQNVNIENELEDEAAIQTKIETSENLTDENNI